MNCNRLTGKTYLLDHVINNIGNVQQHTEARLEIIAVKSNKNYWVWVYLSALIIQDAKRSAELLLLLLLLLLLSSVASLAVPYFSTLSHKRHNLRENAIKDKICDKNWIF